MINKIFELQRNIKFYEIIAYEENGFASSTRRIGFYKNRKKAQEKCDELRQKDDDIHYQICEKTFED